LPCDRSRNGFRVVRRLKGIREFESPPLSAPVCVIYTFFAVLLPILRRVGSHGNDDIGLV
jgi:hypothetical protein